MPTPLRLRSGRFIADGDYYGVWLRPAPTSIRPRASAHRAWVDLGPLFNQAGARYQLIFAMWSSGDPSSDGVPDFVNVPTWAILGSHVAFQPIGGPAPLPGHPPPPPRCYFAHVLVSVDATTGHGMDINVWTG